jgi:hypothetical protein
MNGRCTVARAKKTAKQQELHTTGDAVQIRPLVDVKPNPWNPNQMTPFMKGSLREGLKTDGWLASQSLLIWGSDEKGKRKGLIIDGEHRWTEAAALGFVEGPMVFLEGMTEASAKALTVKMNQKRGENDKVKLAELIRSVQPDFAGDLGIDLGIEKGEMAKYLVVPQPARADTPEPKSPDEVPSTSMKMAQLYFDEARHKEFRQMVKELAAKFGSENVTDTTLEIVRRAHSATK